MGGCYNLKGIYFLGDSPTIGDDDYLGLNDFNAALVYYLPGTTGWSSSFSKRPTVVWERPAPLILTSNPEFGPRVTGFTFRISWASSVPLMVEATTDPGSSVWSPLGSVTLTNGTALFTDTTWNEHPARHYRIRPL